MTVEQSKLLHSAASAAKLLDTTERRIHELRRAGKLGAVQDGRTFKFRHDELQRYADTLGAYEPGRSA